MTKHEHVIKNYIYNTLYELLRILAPLITAPYVSRVLGAEGVGTFDYVQSIATYFVLIGAMGTTLYGQREIAYVRHDPQKRTDTFWEIEVFRVITSLICTAIFFFSFSHSEKYSVIFQILTLEVLATSIDISWLFMGMEDFKTTVIRNTIIKLGGIALVFLLVKTPQDVPVYALCMSFPIFIGNLSLWLTAKKYVSKPGRIRISHIISRIKPILILFIPQVAIEIYAVLDKTMIGIICTDIEQVGYYTQAQKIIKVLLMIVISLGTVMLPAMSAAFAQGKMDEIKRDIKRSFSFVFMISVPLAFGVSAIAREFVPLFFGKGFEPAATVMAVLSPILIIIGMSNVIGKQFLLPTKQQKAFTVSVCVGAAVNLVLNAILITCFKSIGAAVATLIAEISVTGVQMWFVRKQLPLKEYCRPLFKYLLMGATMFASVFVCGKYFPSGAVGILLMVLTGVVVYFAELLITKDELLFMGIDMCRKKLLRKQGGK